MDSSPRGFFCSANRPNALETAITMSLQHPRKPTAPDAFVPHPLPGGTVPFRGVPAYSGRGVALGASRSRAGPVGTQHPVAQHKRASCLQPSFFGSFIRPSPQPSSLS